MIVRPSLSARQRTAEQYRRKQSAWKSRQISPLNLIACAVCGTMRARAAIIYGNGGENGFDPACSQTCAELLRQRKGGAA